MKGSKDSIRRKILIVGDARVGKTQLLSVMAGRGFSTCPYQPMAVENQIIDLEIDEYRLELALWDTHSQELSDRLRPMSYSDCAVIIICFAFDDLESFNNVGERWLPEVLHFTVKSRVPLLLVGCKSEFRGPNAGIDGDETAKNGVGILHDHGKHLAEKIGATAYRECSSKTGEGIDDLCKLVGKLSLSRDRGDSRGDRCLIF